MNTIAAAGLMRRSRQLLGRLGLALAVVIAAPALAEQRSHRHRDVVQAPALPGKGAPISSNDRVYTADQTSNTVTVIDPSSNTVLGTIALGQPRVNGVLGPVDEDQVNVHGLGFSRDGRLLDAIAVTSNAAVLIDTVTNKPLQTTYLRRAPHEGFVSPDGRTLWVAERGVGTVAVIDIRDNEVAERIETGMGPSKVVFSPDGDLAYVNHLDENVVAVVKVASRKVIARVAIPAQAGGSADEAVSPDGAELWLGHPGSGFTTVVDARHFLVKASFETGPRTNHPNFVSLRNAAYAYVTVGDLNVTKVFLRQPQYVGALRQIAEIPHAVVGDAATNCQPHGIWPSPDNTRIYVALQKCDRVEVVDTATNRVIARLAVGQDPQALVYVAGASGTANLGRQGLDKQVRNFAVEVQGSADGATGQLQVREVLGLDELDLAAEGLAPDTAYTLFGRKAGGPLDPIMTTTSDGKGSIAEALAFVRFFGNWTSAVLAPAATLQAH